MTFFSKLATNAWFRFVKKILFYLFIGHWVYLLLLLFIPVFTTPTILWRQWNGKKIHKEWVSYSNISEYAKEAVIAAEDQLFDEHFGFDIKQIEKAFKNNQKKKKRIKGASTISQQVAKNVFLWQGRSWFRKVLEAYFTLMIELCWSKERILEVYLNVAEMGDGVFGIEAAAKQFFNKPAASLTAPESALIAAVLPNPIKFKVKNPSAHVLKRKSWILNQMNQIEWEDMDVIKQK
jgi:monofunctional biosynthetic peptidoglycan transglycosylase